MDFTTTVRREGPRVRRARPTAFVSGAALAGVAAHGGSHDPLARVDDTDVAWWAAGGAGGGAGDGADGVDEDAVVSGAALAAPAPDLASQAVSQTGSAKDGAGATSQPQTFGDDLLAFVASKLSIPRVNPEAGFVKPLAAFDQGQSRQCVASATCTAVYLAAVLRADARTVPHLRRGGNSPSVTYAYHTQQRLECLETSRVVCGLACGGECEDGGTVMSYMIRVWRDGVPFESAWPLERARDPLYIARANEGALLEDAPHYRLTAFHRMPVSMPREAIVEQLQLCVRSGMPVVLNLVGYGNQEAFSQAQTAGCDVASTWSDARHTMPAPEPATRRASGHAVVLVGFDAKRRAFRIRNSYGPDWGCWGDFALPFDLLGKEARVPQLHGALVIAQVQLENL